MEVDYTDNITARDALNSAIDGDSVAQVIKDNGFKVFTSEHEAKKFCSDCIYRAECIMLQHINKLSMKRDGIPADKVWGCTTFKEE